jgi:hypothetical protein
MVQDNGITNRNIIQIVPEIAPGASGVGDYALGIARALRKHHGLNTLFVVVKGDTDAVIVEDDFPIVRLSGNKSEYLAQELVAVTPHNEPVLVQYSGYGYDKHGVPRWLIEGLRRWKTGSNCRRVVTMFHELYAKSWPWRRAFWHTRQQQLLACELARLSDACMTSRQGFAAVIRRWRELIGLDNCVHVQPIPSNVGEPERVPPLSERRAAMAVFGHEASRAAIYRDAALGLWKTCENLGIEEIVEIGPGEQAFCIAPAFVNVRRVGKLDATQVSQVLLDCRAGFVNYPVSLLSKSGVFASYCAHSLVPVLPVDNSANEDGVIPGRHYFNANMGYIDLSKMQAIANAVFARYAGHCVQKHAKLVASLMRDGNLRDHRNGLPDKL